MRHRCLVLLAAATSALAASIAQPSAQDIPQAAFDELKHGGFVLMFAMARPFRRRERRKTSPRSISPTAPTRPC